MGFVDPREGRDLCKDYSSQPWNAKFGYTWYLPCNAFLCSNGIYTLECTRERRWNSCLHADLDRFEGAETKIGKELGGGRGRQKETGLPFFGVLLSHKSGVEVFEELVTSVLDGTLHGVAEKGWTPASKDSSDSLSPANRSPSFEVALVEVGIDLTSAFDEIERSHRGMCCTLGDMIS